MTSAPDLREIQVAHDFRAPAEALWALLADFADIQRWWPRDDDRVRIERVDVVGEGIGQVRHIFNAGFVAPVSERLDAMEASEHRYALSIVGERPAGLLQYRAEGVIESLSPQGCRLRYHGRFRAEAGREEEADAFLRGAYELMFRGLADTLVREATPGPA